MKDNPFKIPLIVGLFLIQVIWFMPGIFIGLFLFALPRMAWQTFTDGHVETFDDDMYNFTCWPKKLALYIKDL